MAEVKKLRMITYMYPGYPVELFQMYQYYLEEVLDVNSHLIVESRHGGPISGKENPFATNEVDIGFISSTEFIKSKTVQDHHLELLPAAPIYIHPKSELKPVYFTEVVVSSEKKEKYSAFTDLRGHKWVYNEENSLSGSVSTLAELKKLGYNASFFSNKIETGSHVKSLEYILANKADAASVDSNVLQMYLADHPEYKSQLHVLCTFGPLPISPIVVNSRLSKELKNKITEAFLNMNKSEKWQKAMGKYKLWGFKTIDNSLYDTEQDIIDAVKGLSVHTAYY